MSSEGWENPDMEHIGITESIDTLDPYIIVACWK